MLNPDIIISKLKLKSKLKDRKRLKGYSFSYSSKEENFESETVKKFRKERRLRKALSEREINSLRDHLTKIRKKIMNIENSNDNGIRLFGQRKKNNEQNVSFFRNILTKYEKQKKIKDEDFNVNKNKTTLSEKFDYNDISKMITEIKNISFNFYKALNNINIKEKLLDKNDKEYKFYSDFLGVFKKRKKNTNCSKKHFNNSSIMSLSNRPKNHNLYYSSFLEKRINLKKYKETSNDKNRDVSDKNSEFIINSNNIFYNTFKSMTSNNISNKTSNKNVSSYMNQKGTSNNSFRLLSSSTTRTDSKIHTKKNHVINKPIYTTNIKYFISNFKKIKDKIKNDKIKRKEGHLATYNNIEKYSKIREDMLMFRLKMKYLKTRFPKNKNKIIDKRKLFFHKFESNIDKKDIQNY